MRSSTTNSVSQANCYFNAVEKVGCKNSPASCFCAQPSGKKSRKISEAIAECATEKCNAGWPAEYYTFAEYLCLTEQTEESCGPESSCPADRDCILFPDKRRRCAKKKSPC